MKNHMMFLLALGLAAVAALGAKPENRGPSRCERMNAAIARHAASAVTVQIFFKTDLDEDADDFDIPYLCPNCNSVHHRQRDRNGEKPYPMAGYLVAPDRVLMQDLVISSNLVSRMEVVRGGQKVAACPVRRYPAEGALELKLSAPLPGTKPLVFASVPPQSATECSYFYNVFDKGLLVSGLVSGESLRVRHFADIGKTMLDVPQNTVVLNEAGEAVSIAFCSPMPIEASTFSAPSQWKGEELGAGEARLTELKRKLRASLVAVYIHRAEEKKHGSGRMIFSSSMDDENKRDIDTLGYALGNGELLVPLSLNASQTAEIDKLEAVLADGTRRKLDFVGAFGGHAAVVLRFADGSVPPEVKPLVFHQGPIPALFQSLIYGVTAANRDGKIALSLSSTRVKEFESTSDGTYLPSVSVGERKGRHGFAVTPAGECFMGFFPDRESRYGQVIGVPAAKLGEMLAKRDFNPEYAPRTGKDRIRVAWMGVEAQELTEELARQKKVIGQLAAYETRGALVSRVHPGTPAAQAGLREGDVLLYARGGNGKRKVELEMRDMRMGGLDLAELFQHADDTRFLQIDADEFSPWPDVEGGINEALTTKFGIGAKIIVAYVRDGKKLETEMTLARAPVHYRSAPRHKAKALGAVFADVTFEVRGYFKLGDDAPGVLVCKVQAGHPAAVAGLRPLEIVTHVNGEPVNSAKRLGELLRGKDEVQLSVRRLAATRVVRIQIKEK